MISQSFIAAAAIWRIKWFVLQDRSGLHIEMNSGLITFFSDAQKYQKINTFFFPIFSYFLTRVKETQRPFVGFDLWI